MNSPIINRLYLNFHVAFAAWRRQKLLEAVLAVQVALLLDETDVDEFTFAAWIHAKEVIWAPGFSQSGDKWSSEGKKVTKTKGQKSILFQQISSKKTLQASKNTFMHSYVPCYFAFTFITNRMFAISKPVGNLRYIYVIFHRFVNKSLIVVFFNVRAAISSMNRQFAFIEAEPRWGIVRVR